MSAVSDPRAAGLIEAFEPGAATRELQPLVL